MPAFRQAKIQQLYRSLGGQKNIGGLHIAVHDSLFVRRSQAISDLNADIDYRLQRKRFMRTAIRVRGCMFGDDIPQGLAFQQLHHQEWPALVLLHLVDRADVRVIQR